LKIIVDKILNKDKEYNQCVTRVTEKEANIDQLKQEIKELELEYLNQRSNRNFYLLKFLLLFLTFITIF